MAIEEKKSNTDGVVIPAENQQETSGKAHAVEAEILENANAEPAAEHTPVTIHPKVQEAGVIEVLEPHHEMLSGSEVHAESVDGSGIALPLKEQKIVTELFASRAHIPGPVGDTSTWKQVNQAKNRIIGLFRRLPKAA